MAAVIEATFWERGMSSVEDGEYIINVIR